MCFYQTVQPDGSRGFPGVQRGGFLRRDKPDLDQVKRADEAVTDPEAADACNRVAQRDRPAMLEQNDRRSRVIGNVLQDIPRLVIGEDVHTVGCCLGSLLRAPCGSLFAVDPKTDEGADRASKLDRL